MVKWILTGLAILGTFLGSRVYVPSMSHTAFTAAGIGISYVVCACFLVGALSLGLVQLGKR